MIYVYYTLASLLILFTILPKIPSSHWVFRVADFGKIQLFFIDLVVFLIGIIFLEKDYNFWIFQSLLTLVIVFHGITLIKYTHLYPIKKLKPQFTSSEKIHFISANVYQFNEDKQSLINLIHKYQPDIFLTMESDQKWEDALTVLESEYPFQHKVPLENTYGMHLYSKLEIEKSVTHYFVADDIPSIEAVIKSKDGFSFVFFGVHPPPPSPTEEETSKERDGDLLAVAKRVKDIHFPTVVVGDFNNVAWSKSSILFRKTSELIDPRVGHGFVSTFHAKYHLLRFPIDLMFHSPDIFVTNLKATENFGSDHLAVYCEFFIDQEIQAQEGQVEVANADEKQEAQEMIQEGIQENSDREAVATED
ncbi:MAG: endonuclease/exonuclease/phosphatase family protein [Pedobacter sp.]|nr:MAG: endonuclease/exonuclease/phosphatase family protein [Pedobacter sp.]